MEKMENLEELGNIQKDIAKAATLTRFLEQPHLTTDQLKEKSHMWFFDNVKRELANRLSVLEAYYVYYCNFHDFDNCIETLRFLDDFSCEIDEFLNSFFDVEESEVDNA